MKRVFYYVHLGRFVEKKDRYGSMFSNYATLKSQKAAVRFLKSHPQSSIDIRGRVDTWRVKFCWKYWKKGKIITQKPIGYAYNNKAFYI